MKLKIYHIYLLTLLFLTLGASITLFSFSIIDIVKTSQDVMDSVIFVICFILLLAFNIVEITNTIVSFKKGSAFIKNLTFDETMDCYNKKFLVGTIIVLALGIAGLTYSILLMHNPFWFLGGTPLSLKYLLCGFFSVIISNCLSLIVFPITGREDKSFLLKSVH